MEEKKLVPKLRFPGFTEPWEQRKLGSIGSTYTGLSGKTKEDFGHGEAQYITYLNIFQNTVSDITMTDKVEIDTTQNEVKYGDVLFTTSSETPEEVGMSSVWLGHMPNIYLNSFCFGFRPNQKIDPYFLGYSLRAPYMRDKIKILAQGISRYNISKNKVMELEISLPNNEEQSLLGNFLRNIDLGITLHQRKLEHLKLKKKSLLQKLFPKEGEVYPELRFPGFTDPWEQRKLGDVVGITSGFMGDSLLSDGKYHLTRIETIADGIVDENRVGYSNEKPDDMYLLKHGDILYSNINSISHMGKVAKYQGNSPLYHGINLLRLQPENNINSDFLLYLLNTEKCRNWAKTRANQAVSQASINQSLLTTQEIAISSFEEQKKIGDYFRNLDHLITLHQRKLEHLQLLKKALLQQLFV